MTLAPAEVRAIYYGPAPTPPASAQLRARLPERDEAVEALAMLRSVAQTGVTYQKRGSRVLHQLGQVIS